MMKIKQYLLILILLSLFVLESFGQETEIIATMSTSDYYLLDATKSVVYLKPGPVYSTQILKRLDLKSGKWDSTNFGKRIIDLYLREDLLFLGLKDSLYIMRFSTQKVIDAIKCPKPVYYVAIKPNLNSIVIRDRSGNPNSRAYLYHNKTFNKIGYSFRLCSKYIYGQSVYLLDDNDNWSCKIYEYNLEDGTIIPIITDFAQDGYPRYLGNGKYFIESEFLINGVYADSSNVKLIVDTENGQYYNISSQLWHGSRCDPIMVMNDLDELIVECGKFITIIDLKQLQPVKYDKDAPFKLN